MAGAGAQAASFPIHFGRLQLDYASRTTLGGVLPERLRPLVQATTVLSDRFRSGGHTLYLVGGSVRDAILADSGSTAADAGRDLDFTTDARPDAIEALVTGWADAVWTQGKRFGTIGCLRGDQKYEITTHRAEAYRPDSRKPEVAFGDKVEDDLARRDFTINAMALRLPELELIDPFDGLVDLSAHRLRTPLDPEVSFADDPLRMLRAARFVARLESGADPGTGRGRAGRPSPPLHRLGGADPGRAGQYRHGAGARRWRCGSWCAPAWPTSSFPNSPASPSSRTRSTGTRTCSPTPWPWWTRPAPTGCCAWPRSSTTWASRRPGRSSTGE